VTGDYRGDSDPDAKQREGRAKLFAQSDWNAIRMASTKFMEKQVSGRRCQVAGNSHVETPLAASLPLPNR
jgi:hypothetical protein